MGDPKKNKPKHKLLQDTPITFAKLIKRIMFKMAISLKP